MVRTLPCYLSEMRDDLPPDSYRCRSREGWVVDGAFVIGVFAAHCFGVMELTAILNRCYRFPGFVYRHAWFSPDKKSIEVSVRPRKGSAAICTPCHQMSPATADSPNGASSSFLPGLPGFLPYAMRRVDCRRRQAVVVEEVPGDDRQTQPDQSIYFVPGRWARRIRGRKLPKPFALPGTKSSTRSNTWSPGVARGP